MRANKRTIHLGYFPNMEEAKSARQRGEIDHGYHPREKKRPPQVYCAMCGNKTNFRGHKRGYAKYCSKKCSGINVGKVRTAATNQLISANMKRIWIERTANGSMNEIRINMSSNFNYSAKREGGYVTTQKGRFIPVNKEKYIGNPNTIIYRSGWELLCMRRFDNDPNIIFWQSEEIIIPYHDRATGKLRRYYPDFCIQKRNIDGTIETLLIEVKPYSQTIPPIKGKSQKQYLRECQTFATNYSKFEFAKQYCARKGWRFVILTERELGLGR